MKPARSLLATPALLVAGDTQSAPVVVETQAPAVSSFLPPQVAQQIRAAQQRAALAGDAPAAWAIGARCQVRSTDTPRLARLPRVPWPRAALLGRPVENCFQYPAILISISIDMIWHLTSCHLT